MFFLKKNIVFSGMQEHCFLVGFVRIWLNVLIIDGWEHMCLEFLSAMMFFPKSQLHISLTRGGDYHQNRFQFVFFHTVNFYEAWKVAEEEEQNKKKKRKKHKKRKSTPDSADRSRSCPRRRSPIEVSTDPYLLECLGEFCWLLTISFDGTRDHSTIPSFQKNTVCFFNMILGITCPQPFNSILQYTSHIPLIYL